MLWVLEYFIYFNCSKSFESYWQNIKKNSSLNGIIKAQTQKEIEEAEELEEKGEAIFEEKEETRKVIFEEKEEPGNAIIEENKEAIVEENEEAHA